MQRETWEVCCDLIVEVSSEGLTPALSLLNCLNKEFENSSSYSPLQGNPVSGLEITISGNLTLSQLCPNRGPHAARVEGFAVVTVS